MVGDVPDHLDHLPAGGAAALAHDRRRAGRAASTAGTRCARRWRSRRGFARRCSWSSRWRCASRSRTTCSTARRAVLGAGGRRARLRGELLRARLARRAPVLRPLRRARAARVDARAACSRWPWRSGSPTGQSAVALGIAAAPLVSLVVVPWALARRATRRTRARASGARRSSSRAARGFAGAVLAIMAAEQALLNAAVLAVDATAADAALAGFVFNVLLITRAPLQLFQAIQTSLLPHLAGPRRRPTAARLRARDPHHGAGDRRLRRRRRARARRRSARGRWACCSAATSTTPAAGSCSSASAWAST